MKNKKHPRERWLKGIVSADVTMKWYLYSCFIFSLILYLWSSSKYVCTGQGKREACLFSSQWKLISWHPNFIFRHISWKWNMTIWEYWKKKRIQTFIYCNTSAMLIQKYVDTEPAIRDKNGKENIKIWQRLFLIGLQAVLILSF